MGKLVKLLTSNITIATGSLSNILRDIFRNESGLKVWLIGNSAGADIDSTASNFASATPGGNIAVANSTMATGWAPTTFYDDVTVEKAGSGYKCSIASIANLDTPAKCAAVAYGDPNRTTFSSLQDFAVRCLDGPLQAELQANSDLVIIDQINEVVHVTDGVSSMTGVEHVATLEQDDPIGTQYGE